MSLSIAPNERGVVRIFALSMTDTEALALRENVRVGENSSTPQQIALGASNLDSEFVEVFPVSDLSDLGLVGYLETGSGIDPDQLASDKAKLSALDGWVLIVYSAAFGGLAQELSPNKSLKLIGRYHEPLPNWRGPPLEPVKSAKPFTGSANKQPASSTAAQSFRLGRIVVAILAMLVALIWMIVR